MIAMASQISGNWTVCSTVKGDAFYRKHKSSLLTLCEGNPPVTGGLLALCEGNPPVTGGLLALCEGNPPLTSGFPTQRASNTENVSMSWHHSSSDNTLYGSMTTHYWWWGKSDEISISAYSDINLPRLQFNDIWIKHKAIYTWGNHEITDVKSLLAIIRIRTRKISNKNSHMPYVPVAVILVEITMR